nr:unnamed protein product [Callosobruchus analis]
MAHLFTSVHEQSYVAYVIAYAAKIGPYKDGLKDGTYAKSANVLCVLVLLAVPLIKYYFQ